MKNIAIIAYPLLGLPLAIYGLYCAWHMWAYIGTGHYWSNPWFYKGHAALFAIVMLKLFPAVICSRAPRD